MPSSKIFTNYKYSYRILSSDDQSTRIMVMPSDKHTEGNQNV